MTTVQSPVNVEERTKLGVKPGDTVRVWQKVPDKDGKIRLQAFEGIVLARKHGNEAGATFTVRRTSGGVGIEKIFPLFSPNIDKIEIVKRSRVRRAKLYYIRDKVAREIRRQMRNARFLDLSTGSDIEDKAKAAKEAEEAEKRATAEAEAAAKEQEAKAQEETASDDAPVADTPDADEKTEESADADEEKKG